MKFQLMTSHNAQFDDEVLYFVHQIANITFDIGI